ncbi:NAD(P)-binding protein [Actinomadura yumaensis]|uniref:NAD(P)-binding protein n=1 Tax=Actinomadura yumaensis TaxID=111807 RepID=UPI00361D49D6
MTRPRQAGTDETGTGARARPPSPGDPPPDTHIAIIGAGLSGLGMGIALRRAGLEDFLILERAGDIGGTWRDNTYPGVGVDVPAQAYQFSFELNPGGAGCSRRARRSWPIWTASPTGTGCARTCGCTPRSSNGCGTSRRRSGG